MVKAKFMNTGYVKKALSTLEKEKQQVALRTSLLLFRPFVAEFFSRNELLPELDVQMMVAELSVGAEIMPANARIYKEKFSKIIFDADEFFGWYDKYTQSILLCIHDFILQENHCDVSFLQVTENFSNVIETTLSFLFADYSAELKPFDQLNILGGIVIGDIERIRIFSSKVEKVVYGKSGLNEPADAGNW